jgi:hypothetical protein
MYVQQIYAVGGRSFWIHNTGPVGCLPYSLDRFLITAAQIDKYGCATPFNEVSQFFNHGLKEAVVQLRKDLPQAAITYVDIYSLKYTLTTQAKKFGKYIKLYSLIINSMLINEVFTKLTLTIVTNFWGRIQAAFCSMLRPRWEIQLQQPEKMWCKDHCEWDGGGDS